MTEIYVDGDACPVREEVYRVAARLRLNVFVVSNGSRPIRPPGAPNVSMVLVGDNADAADDWIAERIMAVDVCVTSDIPLASRCLKNERGIVSSTEVDPYEYRQCVGRSRDSTAPKGIGSKHQSASPADPKRQVSFPQRSGFRRTGCVARGGPLTVAIAIGPT